MTFGHGNKTTNYDIQQHHNITTDTNIIKNQINEMHFLVMDLNIRRGVKMTLTMHYTWICLALHKLCPLIIYLGTHPSYILSVEYRMRKFQVE